LSICRGQTVTSASKISRWGAGYFAARQWLVRHPIRIYFQQVANHHSQIMLPSSPQAAGRNQARQGDFDSSNPLQTQYDASQREAQQRTR